MSRKQGEFLAGVHSVQSALSNDPENVLEVFVDPDVRSAGVRECLRQARELGIAIHDRSRDNLNRQFGGQRHQGIVARYRPKPLLGEADLPSLAEKAGREALFLVLDGVQDPHNLGACLRSAEAAVATAVIIPRDRAVGITATVRQTSAGAADRVVVVQVTNLARALEALKNAGVWVTGTVAEDAASLYDTDLSGPVALVLGAEGTGLRRLTRETCDTLAAIPMPGGVGSLNVSVAAGVCLFEVLRQRAKGLARPADG